MRYFMIFLIVAFLGYSASWYWDAAAFRTQVETTLADYNTKVKIQNPRVTIKYGALHVRGFPLHTDVIMEKPEIISDEIMRVVRASAGKLRFRKEGEGATWKVIPEGPFAVSSVRGNTTKIYGWDVDAMPKIWLSLVNQMREIPGNDIKKIGVQLPEKTVLHVQVGDVKRMAEFKFATVPVPLWQDMPHDIVSPLDFFIALLEEMEAQRPQ